MLVLILGPMKSSKSFELIKRFLVLKEKNIAFEMFQSLKNVRDKGIQSRNGLAMKAKKIKSLFDINVNTEFIGIDEIHMFEPEDTRAVAQLLEKGKKIIVSGLDKDYQGKNFLIIDKLLELADEVDCRKAKCEICGKEAIFTQVFNGEKPVLKGMPPVIPDDGNFNYKPVCKNCFVVEG